MSIHKGSVFVLWIMTVSHDISATYIAMLSYIAIQARILRISTVTGLKTSGILRII